MIETLEARIGHGYIGKPLDVARDFSLPIGKRDHLNGWHIGRGGSVVSPRGPGGTVLSLEPVAVGPNRGSSQWKVKANLPNLVHGPDAAYLTLNPAEVQLGISRVVAACTYWVEGLPFDLGQWKPTRVDANITAEIQEDDAYAWLNAVAERIKGGAYGEPVIRRTSHLLEVGKEEKVVFYSKSVESGHYGPRGGHLVRIEDRVYGRKCRSVYGESLANICEEGSAVAKSRLDAWVGTFGTVGVTDSIESVALMFVKAGETPEASVKWAGIAIILRARGIHGLIDIGISRATAYRWRARVEQMLEGRSSGVAFSWDDVTYAVGQGFNNPNSAHNELAAAVLALQGIAK